MVANTILVFSVNISLARFRLNGACGCVLDVNLIDDEKSHACRAAVASSTNTCIAVIIF